MKTIACVLCLMLALVPVVCAEEIFNPDTGEWETVPDTDEMSQDPYGDQSLHHDPDVQPDYGLDEDLWSQQPPQDEAWSEAPEDQEDQWDQEQPEDDWDESHEDEWDEEPPPDEGYSDAYGDQWEQQEPQEESWSHSRETEDRRGPPPFLRVPSGRR